MTHYTSDSAPHQPDHTSIVLRALAQPLTVTHLADRLGIRQDTCTRRLTTLKARGLVQCLNETAQRSRVYGLTSQGRASLRNHDITIKPHDETIDWALYGWLCFTHRTAIVLALDTPCYPSAIKRRARYHNPDIKLSANNVRDAIKLLLAKDIVRPVHTRQRAHPLYELTALGRQLQTLVLLERGSR